MSDTGDEDFKSLFDDDFDKTKGRKSAGLLDDSMVKNQQKYAASKTLTIFVLSTNVLIEAAYFC
jgi:hypothetical protein